MDNEHNVWKVVDLIELLRQKRQRAYRKRAHPEGKRFTQEELDSVAYHSYKNLLKRRSHRLPPRAALLKIADYLECTAAERNGLLLTAQYLPLQEDLTGSQKQALLKTAQIIVANLPFPAYLVTHKLQLALANQPFLNLCGLTRLTQLPVDRRTEMHIVFDPRSPLRSRLSPSGSVRDTNMCTAVADWWESYWMLRHEPWYQTLVEHLRSLPDFDNAWRHRNTSALGEPYTYTVADAVSGRTVELRTVTFSLSSALFPKIAVYVPHNAGAGK